jgi:hypothetical protein
MKKATLYSLIFLLAYSAILNAKVLIIVEYNYCMYDEYITSDSCVPKYQKDLLDVDFKQSNVVIYRNNFSLNTQQQCEALWDTISNKYANSLRTGDTLEGVVMVGNLPCAWREDLYWHNEDPNISPEDIPDDRYFMDICDQNHNVYSSDNVVWDFDATKNLFTIYHSPDQHLDIWVSRIMADQIRGLRNGLIAMDEYTIINNYFARLHARMTQPAKVPPRGFAMGGISEWGNPAPDPCAEVGFGHLNLRNVFDFRFPSNRPSNWLLQLVWGPYGGTTLGAFNGTRYSDVPGQNEITWTNSQLWDYKTSSNVSVQAHDTMGYEWAGIYEHSNFNTHAFNQSPDSQVDQTPFGIFTDATLAAQWCPNNLNVTGSQYYHNSAYVYNPDNNTSNPWDAICGRGENSIFKALIPTGAGGTYHIYLSYPSSPSNSNWVYGMVHSWARDHSFYPYAGLTRVFGFPNLDSIYGWHYGLSKIAAIDMTTHNPAYTYPGTNFECIHDLGGNLANFTFNDNDTAWIEPSVDAGNLIADAVMLVPTAGGSPIIIDNSDLGFASNNWYDRSFLDMQDEDAVNHNSISKVPFFISSGCETGNYMCCYDPADVSHNNFETSPHVENCLGLLYGMAHSGLISFTSAISYPEGEGFDNFTIALAGKDSHGQPNTFGNALLAKCNNDIGIPMVLIGAGTLRADSTAYVPYGIQEVTIVNQQISNTVTYSDPGKLVWLQGLNVTSSGNCTTVGKEVRIYAESDLKGAMHITASN